MTQEQIEQAAKGYAYETVHTTATDQNGARHIAFRSFIAGAQLRQAEIEEWKQKFIDATCRNDEARDVIIPELLEALENLVFLHGCEQEGIACGQPTAKQWIDAVEAAQKTIDKAKGENR